jgi:FAD synthetase
VVRAALLLYRTQHPEDAATATGTRNEGFLDGCLPVVYFVSANNFPEVLEFMGACERCHGFETRHLDGFKPGLESLIAGGMQAVIMGTRSSDPDGVDLEHFSPTSLNWPPAMRVCPILHWSYQHVWEFLRGVKLPYCCLYDSGYTSLGSVRDSVPNPLLRVIATGTASGVEGATSVSAAATFLPAYMLQEGCHERLGRTKAVVKNSAVAGGLRGAATPDGGSVAASLVASSSVPTVPHAVIPTAAIVVIGDEVLSGRVRDANGAFLCASLSARGIRVDEVCIIPDDAETIAAVVRRLAPLHTYVISCGGLGPTHDDITMRGIGAAFSYKLQRCPEFERFLRVLATAQARGAVVTSEGAVGSSGVAFRAGSVGAAGLAQSDAAAAPTAGSEAIASAPAAAPPALAENPYLLRMAELPFGPDVTLLYQDGTASPAFASVSSCSPTPDGLSTPAAAASASGLSAGSAIVTDPAAAGACLRRGYPLVRVRNVYVFPGVPAILRRKWRSHAQLFTGVPAATALVRVAAREAELAGLLEEVTSSHPAVKVGSYPADEDPMAHLHGVASPALGPAPSALAAAGVPGMALDGGAAALHAPGHASVAGVASAASSAATLLWASGSSRFCVSVLVSCMGAGSGELVDAATAALQQALLRAGIAYALDARADGV